ncbi:hypothetical protein ZIOFF_033167 [Zingiber officinale]|uniref:Uncharacterized protein n=1 Tax=Zingiber officinale TaxID=94328 RepID=A0A8J5L1N4_ZINOF|nr:hypothetical protein ZIOFF_033167 [Zingiber officinale]
MGLESLVEEELGRALTLGSSDDLGVLEIDEPIIVSYKLTLSSGTILDSKATRLFRWEKDKMNIFLKRDEGGTKQKSPEPFSQVLLISRGLLHPTPLQQTPLLSSKLLSGPNWAESPVSAYMRYLESSLLSSDTSRHPRPPLPSPGLLPSPRPPFPFPSPSPRGLHNSASLPPLTPPSAFPSPTAFLDLLSPRSPYPLLSPGFRYPTPLTPNFALSSLPQPGILGVGPSPGLQPPPSPGLWFPQSPSGFLPILSPRWRDILTKIRNTILKMMMKTTAGLRNSSGDIGGIDSGVQDPSVAGIRWIQDSRDQYTKERLDSVIDQYI